MVGYTNLQLEKERRAACAQHTTITKPAPCWDDFMLPLYFTSSLKRETTEDGVVSAEPAVSLGSVMLRCRYPEPCALPHAACCMFSLTRGGLVNPVFKWAKHGCSEAWDMETPLLKAGQQWLSRLRNNVYKTCKLTKSSGFDCASLLELPSGLLFFNKQFKQKVSCSINSKMNARLEVKSSL